MRYPLRLLLLLSLVATALFASEGSESGFQLAPAPVPYPVYAEGRVDYKLDMSYLQFSLDQYTLKGPALTGKMRKALSDSSAFDAALGLLSLNGQLPGIGPLSPIPAYASNGSFLGYYQTIPASTGNATVTNLAFSVNYEFRVAPSDSFGLIFFGGPSFNMSNVSLRTPYNLYYAPTGTTYTGYRSSLTTSVLLLGMQAGMQVDIPLGSLVRLSPFVVLSTYSGEGYIEDDPGYSSAGTYSADFSLPSSSTTSLGFDIFIDNISIGAMAQSGKSTQTGSNSSYMQLTVGMVFGSSQEKQEVNEEKKEEKPAEAANDAGGKKEESPQSSGKKNEKAPTGKAR